MKVLVVGSGGREHAIAWRLSHCDKALDIFVAPGNGGTDAPNAFGDRKVTNIPLTDINQLVDFAKTENIDLTIVGPEAPLSEGIVDRFREAGLDIFGPSQKAAQLESSKDFAKAFMVRHNIPTAKYQTFTDAKLAHEYINQEGVPIVIKADGLAAGKGVVVAMTKEQAHEAIDNMLENNQFGQAGAKVVIEEFLTGEEASFIVVSDGNHIVPLATSQDHKRLLDGDLGPNTGGMGAYSPAPVVTPDIFNKIMRQIIRPTVEGMAKEGIIYTGFLYAGVMITEQGEIKTLEFNCRMGDPETQPIMVRLKSDLYDLLKKAVHGKLLNVELEWDRRTALGVVIAAAGYPNHPETGDAITLPTSLGEDGFIFQAGTKIDTDGKLVTSGGRVLCCVGLGDSPKIAQKQAYQVVDQVSFNGMQYRTDIGFHAIKS